MMSQVGTERDKMLDELSLGLVMVDPGDLMALGEVLEKVENLAAAFGTDGSPESRLVVDGMKRAVEAIILEKVKDKGRAMELVGQGVGLLQQIVRGPGSQFGGELAAYLSGLKNEANIDLKPSQPSSATAEGGAPSGSVAASPQAAAETAAVEEPMVYDVGQDQDLFFGFIAESMEHIESIEVNIITLEQDPTDKETINSVFRPFHTIKGVSGFLNLRQIHSLTHDVENLLDEARNDHLAVTPAVIDVVLDAVDILKRMISDVKVTVETGEAVDSDYGVPEFLDRLHAVQQGDAPAAPETGLSPYGGMKLGEILIDQNLLTEEELDRLLSAQEEARLRRLGEIVVEKGLITAQDLEDALRLQMESGGKRLGEILVESGKADPNSISQAIREQESLREQHLGEMLIKEKQAEARDVTNALREQRKGPESGGAAGGIAHDFNNILGAITGNTELALLNLPKDLPVRSNLKRILSACERAKNLTRQILTFSRVTEADQKPVQVKLIIKEVLKLLRASLPATIDIQARLTSDGYVLGDPTEIHQMLMNLCTNSAQAMADNGGTLGVSVEESWVDASHEPDGHPLKPGLYLAVTVSDTGPGIDEAVKDRIFDPFFTTKAAHEGTGLGLAVVHGIVTKMGGTITLSSRPGQGAVFQILLTAIHDQAAAVETPNTEVPPGKGEHILLVDDEAALVDTGARLLEGLGYRVTGTTAPLEALEIFTTDPAGFDLVITDQTMPTMTGEVLVGHLMKVRPDIPVIVCTGYSRSLTKEAAERLGIKALAFKPLARKDLAQLVRNVLDQPTFGL